MNHQVNSFISDLRGELTNWSKLRTEAGEGHGATNSPNTAEDDINGYLEDIVTSIMVHTDTDAEEAVDFMLKTLDSAQTEGMIPEFPGTDEEDIAEWLAYAKDMGLSGFIVDAAAKSEED